MKLFSGPAFKVATMAVLTLSNSAAMAQRIDEAVRERPQANSQNFQDRFQEATCRFRGLNARNADHIGIFSYPGERNLRECLAHARLAILRSAFDVASEIDQLGGRSPSQARDEALAELRGVLEGLSETFQVDFLDQQVNERRCTFQIDRDRLRSLNPNIISLNEQYFSYEESERRRLDYPTTKVTLVRTLDEVAPVACSNLP